MKLWHEIAGEGPPIVLLHAGVCDSRMWEPQWQTFPKRHRTMRCDLRGFGRTPIPPDHFSNARDVIELLDGLRLGPCAIVGVSMGGRVALEVAIARPDLVDKLVLVGSGLPGHEWSDAVERYGELEEAALRAGDLDAAVEANIRMWVDGPERQPDQVDPNVRRLVGEMQRNAFELQVSVLDRADEDLLVAEIADRAKEITVPTLVVVGALDVSDIHEIADLLTTTIPGARKVEIASAAHIPSMERPEEFDRIVLDFLRST